MRTRRSLIVLFTLAVGAALLAGACGSRPARLGRRATQAAAFAPGSYSFTPLPVRPLSPESERLRVRAMQQAAAARGLAWQVEPGMTELTGWEYGTRAREMAEVLGGEEMRAMSRLAAAGGLLPDGTDLATLAASFTAASSTAIYSPFDKRVLLLLAPERGEHARTDEPLLAHELTHALQDQHFDLLKLLTARPYNFDRTEAAFAIVEGDATSVQRRVERGESYARLSPEEVGRQEEARFGAYRNEAGRLFPPLLTETFIFRYRDGVRLVETLRRRGGVHAADELFRRPPASSEQVLHPEKYFANEQPREVRIDEEQLRREGWSVAASTPLGEIGVRGLLLKSLSRKDADSAAAGWGGDCAYLFEREGRRSSLFAWETAWDTATDAQEFFRAYNTLERSRGASEAGLHRDDHQRAWREGELLTVVRLENYSVLVLRGRESDVTSALELIR